ncbi:MAG: hypothetical protein COA44_12645 [Arcobacter sp.]|nr:MAG: hypothetical protein COA44_12645 [Arcobacter sp.]
MRGPTNREIQLQKTCELYAYVLEAQGKEVAYAVQECADSYDYPIDCVKELAQALKDLDSESFEKIVNNTDLQEARDLANWWTMYESYIPVPKSEML